MPQQPLILATVKENGSLSVFDAGAGAAVDVIEVGRGEKAKPHEIALNAEGTRAFVSLYGDKDYGPNTPWNEIAVVDLKKRALITRIDLDLYKGPHGLVCAADGKIWATVDPNRCVLVIDPETFEIERTLFLEVPGHFIAASPDKTRLYVSAKEYPRIVEIDVAAKRISHTIELPVGAQGLRTSLDGRRLYVGDFNRPLLHIIDCQTHRLTETVSLTGVPGWPFPMAGPDGTEAYVVVTTYDEPNDMGYFEILDAADPGTSGKRRAVKLAAEPFHALAEPDGRHALCALADGEIVRIDLEKAELVDGGFHAGGVMPEALLYLPS